MSLNVSCLFEAIKLYISSHNSYTAYNFDQYLYYISSIIVVEVGIHT